MEEECEAKTQRKEGEREMRGLPSHRGAVGEKRRCTSRLKSPCRRGRPSDLWRALLDASAAAQRRYHAQPCRTRPERRALHELRAPGTVGVANGSAVRPARVGEGGISALGGVDDGWWMTDLMAVARDALRLSCLVLSCRGRH